MPDKLKKIIKLTQAQYDILEAGGTAGGYTGLDPNYIYHVEDTNEYVTTTGNFTLQGHITFASGLTTNHIYEDSNHVDMLWFEYDSQSGSSVYTEGHIILYGDNDDNNPNKPDNVVNPGSDIDITLFNTGFYIYDADDQVSYKISFPGKSGTFALVEDLDDYAPISHIHSANDITTGVLADARIPSLSASKITSGTFDIARIPTGNTSTTVALGNHNHDGTYVKPSDLATVATTGSYNDLTDKPTIPVVDYPVTDVKVGNTSVVTNKVAILGTLAGKSSLLASDIPSLDASKITSGTFADARIASASTWNSKYTKPATGIPASDLEESYLLASTAYLASASVSGNTLTITPSSGSAIIYTPTFTDTGATSVEVTGSGNAVTTASYDATTRKITLTKGTTFLTAHQAIKKLDTTATTSQTSSSNESIVGPATSTIILHKISKTGSYNDLLDKPTIPVVDYPVTDVQVNGTSVLSSKIANIPAADASTTGVVTTSDQTFAGTKTFASDIILNNNQALKAKKNNSTVTRTLIKLSLTDKIILGDYTGGGTDIIPMGNIRPDLTAGSFTLGTSTSAWTAIYGTTIYENGTALSAKYQPLDADLTAIAELSGTSGFLKKTAANTWTLDTNTYSLSSHNHDGVYVKPLDLAAVATSGAYTDLSGTPTSLKNPNSLGIKTNGDSTAFVTYDGSTAVTLTFKASSTFGAFEISDGTTTKTIQLGGSFTDKDHYHTSFSWTNGTTAGPTGSLTGNTGTPNVSFGAIPSASVSQSGVVTTGNQTFAGVKTFDSYIKLYDHTMDINYSMGIDDDVFYLSTGTDNTNRYFQVDIYHKQINVKDSDDQSGTTFTFPESSGTFVISVNNVTPDVHGNVSLAIPTTYIKSASVSGNTLTLTKQDDGTIVFTPTFTDTDTWRAIQVDSTEKLGTATTTGALNFISQNTNNGDVTFTYNNGIKATAKIPTSLKNPNFIKIQGNGDNVSTYDGSSVKTFNWAASSTAGAFTISDGTTTKTIQLAGSFTDTTYTFAEGSTNGAFSVTPSGGTAQSVSIHGLASLAYKSKITSSDVDTGYYLPTQYISQASVSGNTLTLTSVGGTTLTYTPSVGVTSIALTMPSIFTVSGSPITSSGTIAVTLNNLSAGRKVFASPSDGTAGAPLFRALIADDIPSLNASKINAGTFADARIASASTWNAKSTVSASTTGTATTEAKYITIDGTEWKLGGGSGTITDVKVNNTSVVSSGVANILTKTAYNSSTNKIATESDLTQILDLRGN